MRFEKPSAIQASTLPIIFEGHNIIAQAQSGAGKTIAFVIGMLTAVDPRVPAPQALCLTPTREIANQIIDDAVKPLSSRIPGIRYECGIAGREVDPDSHCTAQVIVGTPGTIKRWIKDGYLNTKHIRIFVLDEADTMVAEKALGGETVLIKQKINPRAQILLFSATYTQEIMDYAKKIVPLAYVIRPPRREELVLDVIFQVRMDINKCRGGKLQVLKDIYSFLTLQQSIVFVEMKTEADAVTSMMKQAGFEVSTLHGGIANEERDRVMNDFRAGRTKVLIATNALARGVDVPAVAAVVNFDLPTERVGQHIVADPSTYLHRIGRCGRFGRRGTAINFLEKENDFKILEAIEKYFRPEKRMTTDWDPNDIEGLSEAIKERPEGGEIVPEAELGNQQHTAEITKFQA
jgi:ATP-dependent RNA helicase DDX19/DBP5